MAKVQNTTKQPRGMHLDGTLYHLGAGDTVEVPGPALEKARKADPVIKGWFDDGEFVVVADATNVVARVTVQDGPAASEDVEAAKAPAVAPAKAAAKK